MFYRAFPRGYAGTCSSKVITICNERNISIKGSVFRRNAKEFKEIIATCERLGIEPKGSIFRRTGKEIEEIFNISNELLGEVPSPNTFNKKPQEVRKIIELCIKNNIKVTGTIYRKTANELEETINYVKEYFGEEYLIPQVIIETKEHLQGVLGYLRGKRLLDVLIKSPSILKLTLIEIIDREGYISQINQKIVTENGTFNPVFGWSRKLYEQKKKELNDKKNSTK